jgi:D-alanyl-D-alanine carboxypeptidase
MAVRHSEAQMRDKRSFRVERVAVTPARATVVATALALLLLVPACGSIDSPRSVPLSSTSSAQEFDPSTTREFDPATTRRLDQEITRTLQQTGVPGVIVGLWSPGRSYVRAFGLADKMTGAPMQTDSYMRIGSETKTFTVTAVLQLMDQGKVGLDDPISKYVSGVPEGDRITLRQLARMQSGLFSYTSDERFQHDMIADPQRPFTPEQILQYARLHPLVFSPGTSWQYSNTNTVLLGLVVERVTGQPLHDYLQQKVFSPLGLGHTSFPTTNVFPGPHPQGYTDQTADDREAIATDWNPSWAWAAGAMISDLDDLHVWVPALATGRLLTPQTQAQRLQTVTPAGVRPNDGYGLGLFNIAGWIGHNGSLPGYQTLAFYLPVEQITMVVLLNSDIAPQDQEPSTLFGKSITRIITPDHVLTLEPAVPVQTAAASPPR